jgi:hypothetical protein
MSHGSNVAVVRLPSKLLPVKGMVGLCRRTSGRSPVFSGGREPSSTETVEPACPCIYASLRERTQTQSEGACREVPLTDIANTLGGLAERDKPETLRDHGTIS